jgi:phosphoribosylaminoimidazole-succinocarboxamide synthase
MSLETGHQFNNFRGSIGSSTEKLGGQDIQACQNPASDFSSKKNTSEVPIFTPPTKEDSQTSPYYIDWLHSNTLPSAL